MIARTEQQITFDESETRPLVRPPIYVPSVRAGQLRFEQVYAPFRDDQEAYKLSDSQMQTLSRFASAAAAKEVNRVHKLSESTAVNKVDEALDKIQADISKGALRFEQRKDLMVCLFDVRRHMRQEIDDSRRSGIEEAQRSYPEFGIMGEEAYLRESFRLSESARGNVEIPVEVAEWVFAKMKVGGFENFADFDKGTLNDYWRSPNPTTAWRSGYRSNIPGVIFTVTKCLGTNEFSIGASLKILYEQRVYKENYRWFDTTKPMNIP